MNQPVKPLLFQRSELPRRAVLVRVLNTDKKEVSTASGFIRKEDDGLWLYTCWHAVTGYDRNDLHIPHSPHDRAYLEIHMKDAQNQQPWVEAIGDLKSFEIPLYEGVEDSKRPVWYQDKRHVPNPDLNAIGIFVPTLHDAVKIRLPDDIRVSDLQVIEKENFFPGNMELTVGDKLYVVGYPYGFSAAGKMQPTPVVLTRYVGAKRIMDRDQDVLLDGFGAPSMSGGPVYVERDSSIYLLGLYTGLIFPDYSIKQREKDPNKRNDNDRSAALGTCSDLCLHFMGFLPFVNAPDEV
jgi:hypothetical protein